ncbi:MAG: TraR/DksA family transcriptional regulator [Sediminibacterium sp.]
MTPEEKTAIKSAIERKIKSTEAAIVEYKDMTQPVAPDVAIGRISRMDAINNKSVMEAALREAEAKLQRLKTALEKINDVDFGNCIKCKAEIPIKRLMIMPDSNKCVKCS